MKIAGSRDLHVSPFMSSLVDSSRLDAVEHEDGDGAEDQDGEPSHDGGPLGGELAGRGAAGELLADEGGGHAQAGQGETPGGGGLEAGGLPAEDAGDGEDE